MPRLPNYPCFIVLFAFAAHAENPQARAPVDLLTGAIDPFFESRERVKFLQQSGPESTIDANEFDLLSNKKSDLMRSFDNWTLWVKYDSNKDGHIDVLEYLEYRRKFRIGVLHFFDGNDNRRLDGDERVHAIEALTSGWVPPIVAITNSALRSGQAAKTPPIERNESNKLIVTVHALYPSVPACQETGG